MGEALASEVYLKISYQASKSTLTRGLAPRVINQIHPSTISHQLRKSKVSAFGLKVIDYASNMSNKDAAGPGNNHSFERMSFATNGGGMQCRICLERIHVASDAKPEVHLKLGVTSPCKCAGSVKLIHIRCLKEWIKSKGSIQCEICHSLYQPQWIEWAFEKDFIK